MSDAVHSIGHARGARAEKQLLSKAERLRIMALIGDDRITLKRARRLMLGLDYPTANEQRCITILLDELDKEDYATCETNSETPA